MEKTDMGGSNGEENGEGRSGALIRANIIGVLMSIDSEELRPIHHLEGRDRYYFMLRISKNNRIDGLTPAEVEFVLINRIMIKGIHRSNIRRDLRNSGELVERFPLGRGYAYKLTKAGEEHLASVLKKIGQS